MKLPSTAIPINNLTIPALFHKRVLKTPLAPAYTAYNNTDDVWYSLNWREMAELVGRWIKAFKTEDVKRGDRVALMLSNGINWSAFDLAAQSLGLIVVPLYSNDRADNVAYILEHTGSKLFLLNGVSFWNTLTSSTDEHHFEFLDRVIVVDGEIGNIVDSKVISLHDWLPDTADDYEADQVAPEDTATIVYTSGTTGRPKGVMLSHRNIIDNAGAGLASIDIFPEDVFLSFLPLSHMLERTAGYYLPMIAGSSIAYARSIQELSDDLISIKPTVLVAVPRIFERLYAKLMIGISKQSPLMRALFELATKTGWHDHLVQQNQKSWTPEMLLQPLLHRLVGRKVQKKLGGKLRVVISGGAPLSFEVAQVLIGLGLPIYQGYGLTEASPVISVNRVKDNNPDTVGLVLPGLEVCTSPDGELLVKGSSVMQGYWRNQKATREVINEEGWLHTGDIAKLEGNHLKIVGRVKDILILSNSEKVSPTDMETAIGNDPLFEQSMIVGEGRPYLTLLAVLNQEMWYQLAEKLDISPEDSSLLDEQVRAAIMKRVEQSLHSFPGFAWVKNISISLNPWTVEQGFLTPTLKLKRKNILSAMRDEIDRMYQA